MTELCREWRGFQSSLTLDKLGQNSDSLLKLKRKQLLRYTRRPRLSRGIGKFLKIKEAGGGDNKRGNIGS